MSPYNRYPLFILLLNLISVIYGTEIVPVLIWSNFDLPQVNTKALSLIKSYHFKQIIDILVTTRPNILLFVEENLSTEDLTWQDRNGESPYQYLKNRSKSSQEFIYLPAVESPVHTLHHLSHLGYNVDSTNGPYLERINLREAYDGETRPNFLGDHDREMNDIFQQQIMMEHQVVAIYTARHASFIEDQSNRSKREVGNDIEALDEKIVMSDGENTILIVTNSPIIYQVDGNRTQLTKMTYASTESSKPGRTVLDVRFGDKSFDFVFNAPKGHAWQLDHVKVEEANVKMYSTLKLGAPWAHSYFCARNITFSGTSENGVLHKISFQSLQMQPHVGKRGFSAVVDCVPYFSAPIWSGIFVVALLLIVLTISLLCIFDIHTMDKFDDCKGGKFISVGAAE